MNKKKIAKYSRFEKRDFKWVYTFLAPTIILFILFYVKPICEMIYTSFTKWNGFLAPEWIGMANYIKAFTNSSASFALKNLFWWAVIACTAHVAFGVLMAFVLFQKPIGWKFTRAVFMVPNVISGAAWALIYKFVFDDNVGFLNDIIRFFAPKFHAQWFFQSPYAFWAIVLTWLFYAVIVTLIVMGDLMAIDPALLEAAKLDGASGWNLIRYIQLPLCRISIGTSVLCSVTSRISMYESIALTTAGGPGDDTMSYSVLLVRAITDYNYGYANAIGVVMFIFGLIIMGVINSAFRMSDSVY